MQLILKILHKTVFLKGGQTANLEVGGLTEKRTYGYAWNIRKLKLSDKTFTYYVKRTPVTFILLGNCTSFD